MRTALHIALLTAGFATIWLVVDYGVADAALQGGLRGGRRLQQQQQQQTNNTASLVNFMIRCLFGVVYYFLIVKNYPPLAGSAPSDAARTIQGKNAISGMLDASCPNCFHALCCTGARGAHTLHSTGVMEYWPAFILMMLCPCCTLCYTNSSTDLNVKLGGAQQSIVSACLCSWCCGCCMIAQDAESLDQITGARTGIIGVQGGV